MSTPGAGAEAILPRAVLDSEKGAVLLAGLAEFKPLGRPARFVDSAAAVNDDYHLALKLKAQGLQQRVRTLQPPRRRDPPANILHKGTLVEAGMSPDAKAKIDEAAHQARSTSTSPTCRSVPSSLSGSNTEFRLECPKTNERERCGRFRA